ncbi:bacillithiol biosynthesis cysteine-adding enzyme BshC [Capnocytophaga felis]|uniref:Putative cysteine ligase BshC n=1 Tax=Capnocytophaga felis TaxID=2267611 RepID=A0A5M4B9F7_9FLAO|nr:bacillithiol biosynthesis cysteine-adding enzyme BshC [Capnocytophaga felis]GET46254.1 putative cysteine ligase BshC [Capnocytophaga felis]GET48207.1 putative cysteine ligase BshC [Capnocytophaga felis]
MIVSQIPFEQIHFFSSLISDYVLEKEQLRSFYNHFPNASNFKKQIEEKQNNFTDEARIRLVQSLKEQYSEIKTSPKVLENIELLSQKNTFTITTGHQLSLFTGHLYFVYKIISTINTAKILSEKYPDFKFIPIYWMATEDHDFEEINHFHLQNKSLYWNSSEKGMTGAFKTNSLDSVFDVFKKSIGLGKNADFLIDLFQKSYLEHNNLADATRFLVNALFEQYGVVIVDGNHRELKKSFIPYIKNDLLENIAYQEVTKTISEIQDINKTYPVQVNPREINLFYLTDNGRNRIVYSEKKGFEIHQTDISFSKSEILEELEKYPERFSPNVIMRPLYQEVILPNLAYIGGGGEIAYWLELKRFFEAEKVPFPILMLRNSALLVSERQYDKIKKLEISITDLFLKTDDLKNRKVKELSDFPIDFTQQKNALKKQFSDLYLIAEKTDITFKNAVKAQETKQLKGLDKLEKRLLKAQKRKFTDELQRIIFLQSELFPNNSLQERFSNFSHFYLTQGADFIPNLVDIFNPFSFQFLVIKY